MHFWVGQQHEIPEARKSNHAPSEKSRRTGTPDSDKETTPFNVCNLPISKAHGSLIGWEQNHHWWQEIWQNCLCFPATLFFFFQESTVYLMKITWRFLKRLVCFWWHFLKTRLFYKSGKNQATVKQLQLLNSGTSTRSQLQHTPTQSTVDVTVQNTHFMSSVTFCKSSASQAKGFSPQMLVSLNRY